MEIDLEEPTRPQIAAVLGVSSRWVGELRSKGDLPAEGASLLENIEAWAQLKYGDPADGEGGASNKLKLEHERARVARATADSKEMDNAERRRELASLPDMTLAFASVIAVAVSRLELVPDLVAKGDKKLRAIVWGAITDALEDLRMARVEEAMGGGADEDQAPGGPQEPSD